MRESGGGLKIKKKTSLFLLLLLHIMSWAHGGPYLRETQKGPKSGISYNYLLALLSHVTTTHLKHQRGGVGPKRYRRARPYIPLFRFVRGKKEKWYSLYQLDNIEAYKLQHVENFCVDITKVFLIYIYFSSSSFLWLERRDRGRHLTRYGIPPSAQPSPSLYVARYAINIDYFTYNYIIFVVVRENLLFGSFPFELARLSCNQKWLVLVGVVVRGGPGMKLGK